MTPTDISRLVSQAKASRPAYQHILPFFEDLFVLQESCAVTTGCEMEQLTPETVAAKHRAKLPLTHPGDLCIDMSTTRVLLNTICDAAQSVSPELSKAAEVLQKVLKAQPDFLKRCVEYLLQEDSDALSAVSTEIEIPVALLRFFLQSAIQPSIGSNLADMKAHLPSEENWDQGICPMCGSDPCLGYLDKDNKRHLICRVCRHDWVLRRISCPYCDNRDSSELGYFVNEEEPEYRVYTCDNCHKYIKIVNLEELSRSFYAPLEDLITTHLDLQAQKIGYFRDAPSLVAC